MSRVSVALLALLFFLPARPGDAGTEVMTLEPLADGDLNHFERVGAWGIDSQSDDVHTLIVCPKGKEDQTLRYRLRSFAQGFQVALEVKGGSSRKGIEFYVVPDTGAWIPVPFASRFILKDAWHDFVVTVENGQAWAKVAGEEGEKVAVPADKPLTFAFKLPKRSEASFRKLKIRFLVVSEEQKAAEEGFVRIFDGKTLDGWRIVPDGTAGFKLAEQRIEGSCPAEQQEAGLIFSDGTFREFILRFRVAQGAKNFAILARPGTQDGAQRPVYTMVDGYFTGDKDWNDVEWNVQAQQVTLTVNGNQVWTQATTNPLNSTPWFLLIRDGRVSIRDVRVKGQNMQPGAAWARYATESGSTGTGGGPAAGGEEAGRPGGDTGSHRMAGTLELFNGKDLEDWQFSPANVWSVESGSGPGDSKLVGLTLGVPSEAQIFYKKLLFTDYRLVFKLQRGSVNAKLLARGVPDTVAKGKAPVLVDLKPEWLTEEWTEIEAVAFGPKLTVKVGGKVVAETMIHEVQGVLGFVIGKESAIGVKDIVWHRPSGQ
jgi:hypothetical protein